VLAEQPRPALFVRASAARAVAACHKVAVLGIRHQPACFRQDEGHFLEFRIEAVLILKRNADAVHVMAVFAVNMDQPAAHRVLRCTCRPRNRSLLPVK
jgi:hypothetical protein